MSDQDFWEELADIIKMGHVETCLGTDKIIALDCVLKAIYETMATIAPQFVDGKNQFMLPAWDSIVYFADSLSTRLRKITNSESNTVSPLADGDFKSDLFKKLRDPIYARGYIEAARSEGEGCLEAARNNVREALGLQRPSPLSKEPLVEVGNGIGESVSATVNEDAILVAEQLTEPSSPFTASGVVVEGEPEAFLGASCVESGKKLGGADIEQSRSGHDVEPPSEEVKRYLSQYLTPAVIEIESAMRHEVMAKKKKVSEQLTAPGDHKILDAIFDERAATITEFAYRIFAVVK